MSLIGQRFYCLTIIDKAKAVRGTARWKCRCDCGGELILSTSQLFAGKTKSCCGMDWIPMKAVR